MTRIGGPLIQAQGLRTADCGLEGERVPRDVVPRRRATPARTYSNLGLMQYFLGQWDASIDAHSRAVKLEPNDHLAWSNLGDALIAHHDLLPAILFYTGHRHWSALADREHLGYGAAFVEDLSWDGSSMPKY